MLDVFKGVFFVFFLVGFGYLVLYVFDELIKGDVEEVFEEVFSEFEFFVGVVVFIVFIVEIK